MNQVTVNEHELLTLLQDLIRINSVNPYLDEDGPGEREIANYIGNRLREMGLEVSYQEINSKAVNVIGILRGTGDGKSIMLNGHIDTVSIKRMNIEPLYPEYRDGKVYGRGSCDMKGSLAAIIMAVDSIKKANLPLRGDVILTFVADEEYKSIGTERLVKEYSADAAIVCEPTNLDLTVAHKGFAWIRLEVFGKAAHGSRPNDGIDAIVKAGKVLVELEHLSNQLKAKHHPILGAPSVHASLISGGTELSTYPNYCQIDIERRTIPGETYEDVVTEMREIIAKIQHGDDQFQAQFEVFFVRHPFEISENEQIAQSLRKSYVKQFASEPQLWKSVV